ncbi:hypothetical protein [Emcibacter sp. SYSU 3D8]|uniref:hypothetical protein n=1 Tax=Emcibacter sp. SYSU 3D8 TaxID=3133969 RepID=UPI0031FF34C1
MALSTYVLMAIFSGMGFVWKHPFADIAAKNCAPIGANQLLSAIRTFGSLLNEPWFRPLAC